MSNEIDDHVEHHQLHICFLPFIAPGHMIPMIDIARLFATRRGVKVTIITTTHNALLFKASVDLDISSGRQIQLHILKFPSAQVGLPEGIENFNSITSPDMGYKLHHAMSILQEPIEQFLRIGQPQPDCIISDIFYPWTTDLALQLGCPRIAFNGTSFFSHCVMDIMWRYKPHHGVSTDTDTFIVPQLPDDKIEMTRLQLPDHIRTRTLYSDLMDVIRDSEQRSYGNIVNSFYELEPSYVDHFRNFMGRRKVWELGPVSLSIKREEKEPNTPNRHECLGWLDSMKPKSVVYVSFGSLSLFPEAQLVEIAYGLEATGYPFVWVVKARESTSTSNESWLPEEMEKIMIEEEDDKKRGMIIKGWAPQVAILEHPAIGGFVTHCGWNSVLESVSAGVPMIAWPLYAEQFYNEKLVTEVLKIGVGVGIEEWNSVLEVGKVLVNREKLKDVVTQLMCSGDEAEAMRKRAMELGEKAKRAVEEGGSSYTSLSHLIEDLKKLRCSSSRSLQ